jgi:pimeloyl-ACP methyl ester carboxylesterase
VAAEQVIFKNGDTALHGTLYLPPTMGKHSAVIVLHASGGGERGYPAYRHLIELLPAQLDVALLLFDRRGSGESNGDFDAATFQDLAADGIAALHYLTKRNDIDPHRVGLWGISQGGWVALLAAANNPEVAFVIAVSAPGVTPAEQMNFAAVHSLREAGYSETVVKEALDLRASVDSYFRGQMRPEEVRVVLERAKVRPWFELAFVNDTLPENPKRTKWFLQMDYDPRPALASIRVPLLFFFGDRDRWVPVKLSVRKTLAATRANKKVSLHVIKGADHYMTTGPTEATGPIARNYLKLLTQWVKRRTSDQKR